MALEYDASFLVSEKKKSKKRKHDKQDNEHFSDAVNIKKKQKKSEIHQDGGVCKEALDTTLNPVHREEKKKKKKKNKKNRKLKALEDKSLPSSDRVDVTFEGSDTRDSKIHKSRKEKKDDCNIEIDYGKNKTEKMKKDKKKKEQSKEKDNGGHKGEKEANVQDGYLSMESEKKKRKREMKMMKDLSATENDNDVTEQAEKQSIMGKDDGGHKGEKEANDQVGDLSKESEKKKRKREKKMLKKDSSTTENDHNDITEQVEKQSIKKKEVEEIKKKKKRSKKVTFSSEVKVDNDNLPKMKYEKKLIRGKWFTPEEDEKVKEAVNNYIIDHNLGENGVDMIMHCMKHRKLRNCWKEIGLGLPHRPYQAVYDRAHVIFERSANNKWSEEEFDQLRKFHAEHGRKWTLLAEITGRFYRHINDAWRRIKLLNKKSGPWSQDEYQKLFDLVNMDLKLKVFTEKKSNHKMLRDNISWTAIAESLGTRTDPTCCKKWYLQLSSPMVREGIWADKDDYLLLVMLFNLDACSVEEVDWDNIIEGRTGEVCRRRWNQMVRHIGNYKTKSFFEQVEILSQRYKLDILEARQIWDNKPYVS